MQHLAIPQSRPSPSFHVGKAELAAAAIATGSATAAGMGAGAWGALGALVLGLIGAFAIAGVTIIAVGAAIAGGAATERGIMSASSAVDNLEKDFYKVILENEPFKSTKVKEITRSY